MERSEKTSLILKQFRKKTKQAINKDLFTEFFYLNRERRVVEFLSNSDKLSVEAFFKKFLPTEFRDFVSLKVLNDIEEEIKTWYYENENLVLVLSVNWGFKKQEISIDLSIENFIVTVIDDNGQLVREVDYMLLNDYIISFLTLQAQHLSRIYENITARNKIKE